MFSLLKGDVMKILRGRAYRNGVMFESEDYRVIATRNLNGLIDVEDERLITKLNQDPNIYFRILERLNYLPFIRGVLEFIRISFSSKLTIVLNTFVLIIGISSLFFPSTGIASPYSEVSIWVLICLIFIVAACLLYSLFLIAFGSTGKYHAAEHMVSNATDRGIGLTISNVRKQSRVHSQCGTNLSMFIVLSFLFLSPINIWLIFKIMMAWSIGLEIYIADHKIVNVFLKPIYWIGGQAQKYVFTSNPQTEHLEVAIACMIRLEQLEKRKKKRRIRYIS
jgi:uncharacterized protein YqhQ